MYFHLLLTCSYSKQTVVEPFYELDRRWCFSDVMLVINVNKIEVLFAETRESFIDLDYLYVE